MSLVDRINRRIAARMRGHSAQRVGVEGDDVVLTTDGQRKTLRLADLTDAFAHHHPNYVGSDLVVTLGFSGGESFQITQGDPGWHDLLAALDRCDKMAVPSWKWQLELLAAGDQSAPLDLLALRAA